MKRLLIANRGEIALRVIKTAHKLGIETIALVTEAEKNAQHSKHATETLIIGDGPSRTSYLSIEKIINAALKTNSNAIHPGYGFLSENVELVRTANNNGIEFVGPSVEAMEKMGSKSVAKSIMIKHGIPVIEGYIGENQDPDSLFEKAKEIGFPVLIKASLGGGGKGMRLCFNESDFFDMLASAKTEAINAFGDDSVIIEKFIEDPRHIEVQVLADKYGNTFHFFERDCSIQRRHQKIIEEAPSNLENDVISKIRDTAVKAAKAVKYTNAGTVEFLFDRQANKFYFMEMNTRLQVEHPVSEMITGKDLVELQLRVAQGENLENLDVPKLPIGHAIEARICAEDPFNGFLPSTGKVYYFSFDGKRITDTNLEINTNPIKTEKHVRFDSALVENDNITQFYDSMIGKLIVWGPDRNIALKRLYSSLDTLKIIGLRTNIPFIRNLYLEKDFLDFNYSLKYFERHSEFLLKEQTVNFEPLVAATVLNKLFGRTNCFSGFRLNTILKKLFRFNFKRAFTIDNNPFNFIVYITQKSKGSDAFNLKVDQNGNNIHSFEIEFIEKENEVLKFTIDGKIYSKEIIEIDSHYYAYANGGFFEIEDITNESIVLGDYAIKHVNDIVAPMPGILSYINYGEGDIVEKGKAMFAIEAMKMEHKVVASRKLKVLKINKNIKDFIELGAIVLETEPVDE